MRRRFNFDDRHLPRTESADHPAEEMSERRDHGQNLIGKSQNLAFRQVVHFPGVRRFGEVQRSGFITEAIRAFLVR